MHPYLNQEIQTAYQPVWNLKGQYRYDQQGMESC